MQGFDINNYKYEEKTVSFDQWSRSYLPVKNHITEGSRLNGALFATSGEDWEFIKTQSAQLLWSLVRQEDGHLVLRNGYVGVRGLEGYVLCERRSDLRETYYVYVTEGS